MQQFATRGPSYNVIGCSWWVVRTPNLDNVFQMDRFRNRARKSFEPICPPWR